jgi:Putative Flp pilus-assembly TadE/G-like
MLRDRGGSERGSVAITVALCLTVLLGFAALVVDIGLNWATRTSAQTAADSAALAGASALITDGGAAAVLAVVDYLDENVDGLASPSSLAWVDNPDVNDGDIACWTLPDPPPTAPGTGCPDGSNALQVITPPINVDYAFAPVLGKASNSIKARAAAAAGPLAPNNCILCLLAPTGGSGLAALGPGGITASNGGSNGGIVVNSNSLAALVTGSGAITADQVRVVGNVRLGLGVVSPSPETGGPPAVDPLEDLPTPDQLIPPPPIRFNSAQTYNADTTLQPGVYTSVTVTDNATVTLQPGVYVFRTITGLTIRRTATVVGNGVTIYLGCSSYPAPCSGSGARFRLEDDGRYLATPPTSGAYAGLSIFADRDNTRTMRLRSSQDLNLAGALYGASMRVQLEDAGSLRVDSLLAVGSLVSSLLSPGAVRVSYDPFTDLIGIGRPVLIR